MSDEKEWVVTSSDNGSGQMKLCFYEKHALGEPGAVVCKELSLYEMEHIMEVAIRCCMFQIKNLSP